MKKGVVKEYDSSKGYGFITSDDGEDYFVHVSGLREYLKNKGVRPGQKVSFEVESSISFSSSECNQYLLEKPV